MICIICKNTFEKAPPEHFIPSFAGGRNTIDCVCQPCNHNILAKLDARIRENVQLSMAIDATSRPIPGVIEHAGGSIRRKVTIQDGRTNDLKFDARTAGGPVEPTNIQITIRAEDDLKLRKVFAKILFETAAYVFGPEEVLKPRYDLFRAFLTAPSEEVPSGLRVDLTVATVLNGNTVCDWAARRNYTVPTHRNLSGATIVLVDNRGDTSRSLVILLGKKAGVIETGFPFPQDFVHCALRS
jgi:hypothetical protein